MTRVVAGRQEQPCSRCGNLRRWRNHTFRCRDVKTWRLRIAPARSLAPAPVAEADAPALDFFLDSAEGGETLAWLVGAMPGVYDLLELAINAWLEE